MDKLTEWIRTERGRLSRLAEALNITPGAVAQWEKAPAERIGDIARFTGISPQELRPDIFAAASATPAQEAAE